MEIQHSMRDGCVVVAFTGRIDLLSTAHILRKDLSHQPCALICDLSGVTHPDPRCAGVFATVANHPASRWPATSFLLCAAQPAVAEVLGRLPRLVPLHTTLEEALDAAVDRPPYLRNELLLAPTPTAPAAARAFVRDILDYWQSALPDPTVVEQAVLLANELAANAVVHARTDLRVRVELRGDWLHIAVHDGSPRLLRLVTPNPKTDPEAEGGRGLWLVEQLALSWGSAPIPPAARSCGAPSPSEATAIDGAGSGAANWLSDGPGPAMLGRSGEPSDRLGRNGRPVMRGNDEVEGQTLEQLCDLADESLEQARLIRKRADQAADAVTQAHRHATSARVRAALAKRRELAAHARAIRLHEQAAQLQERLGHPDRAATARAHAQHARELQVQALEEQREQER